MEIDYCYMELFFSRNFSSLEASSSGGNHGCISGVLQVSVGQERDRYG